MHKFTNEKDWAGTAEALARHARDWMQLKRIGDPSFEPNERLVRDYVARDILSKPSRQGKEAIFGFEQLAQFLACRAMLADGWPLSKISEELQLATIQETLDRIPGESAKNDALSLIEAFKTDGSPDAKRAISKKQRILASRSIAENEDVPSFLKRGREHSKTDIKDVLQRLGSDLDNTIRDDFTVYQLASWLILMVDQDKAKGITRHDAENIGRGVTAALLNRNSYNKEKLKSFTKTMRDLSSLEEKYAAKEYDVKRAQSEIDNLYLKIEQTKAELEEQQKNAILEIERINQEIERRHAELERLHKK